MLLRKQLWPDWEQGHDPTTSLWELWEPVRQQFPESFMGIDCFPANVPDNSRYAQIETCYSSDPERSAIVDRFLRVLDLLWVYSPTYAETQHPHEESGTELEATLKATYKRLCDRLKNKPLEFSPVDSLQEFRALALLGLRDIVPSVFIFTKHNIVLWQNSISFSQLYLGDLNYKETLRTICSASGLFLRG